MVPDLQDTAQTDFASVYDISQPEFSQMIASLVEMTAL